MKIKFLFITLIFIPLLAFASEAGYGPWKFGMTKEAVTAIKEFGPYKDVESTEGLETFNAEFDGEKIHISFVFENNSLAKMQIWVYIGKDSEEALAGWIRVYKFLEEHFGEVEFPEVNISQNADLEKIKSTYRKIIHNFPEGKNSKVQMGLKEMPQNMKVYASLFKQRSGYYYVFLYYTNP